MLGRDLSISIRCDPATEDGPMDGTKSDAHKNQQLN
jgi:hypothetical protein